MRALLRPVNPGGGTPSPAAGPTVPEDVGQRKLFSKFNFFFPSDLFFLFLSKSAEVLGKNCVSSGKRREEVRACGKGSFRGHHQAREERQSVAGSQGEGCSCPETGRTERPAFVSPVERAPGERGSCPRSPRL